MTHDTLTMIVTLANAVFTTFRIVAHVPQFIAIVRDRCGAGAISISSWTMFTLANGSNAAYALVAAGDITMSVINGISTLSCIAIVIASVIKQREYRRLHAGTQVAVKPAFAR